MNAIEIAEVVAHGVEMITKIAGLIADTSAGKLDPAEAMAKLQEVHNKILADRATVDAELAAEFPTPIPTGLPGPGEGAA